MLRSTAKLKYQTVRGVAEFLACLQSGSLRNCVVQGLDLSSMCVNWEIIDIENSFFFGCKMSSLEEEAKLRRKGAHFFAIQEKLPYNPYRATLYTRAELMEGFDPDPTKNNSLDSRIERYFDEHGRHDADIIEALFQRIHDYSIDEATKELLDIDPESALPKRKAIGFMGGHLARRDNPHYRKTAELARIVARAGYFVTTGGGPGIMEAANLGAYLAPCEDGALDVALDILAKTPEYQSSDGTINFGYIHRAMEVLERYPNGEENLAIPTWFYGNEPVNMFASHIGKYFSNSIREDGLLSISVYGVVFAPGSAATIQEVFTDAAQNHYGTFDFYSPMVFLGESHYLQSQVYSCLAQQAVGHIYSQMITISDTPQQLLKFIQDHPPVPVSG